MRNSGRNQEMKRRRVEYRKKGRQETGCFSLQRRPLLLYLCSISEA